MRAAAQGRAGAILLGRKSHLDGRRSHPGLGVGYTKDFPVGACGATPSCAIGAGTSEIRRMLIGRELFAETV
jgi:isovaleryl-CoA dehydrogenase